MELRRIVDLKVLSSPRVVELTPDGKGLLCASSALQVLDLQGRVKRTLRRAGGYGMYQAFVTKGGRALGQSASLLRRWVVFVWDRDGGLRRTLPYRAKITGIAVSPDARWLVAHGSHKPPAVWDLDSGAALGTVDAYATSGLLSGVRFARFARDGRLVTLGNNGRICVWEISP